MRPEDRHHDAPRSPTHRQPAAACIENPEHNQLEELLAFLIRHIRFAIHHTSIRSALPRPMESAA